MSPMTNTNPSPPFAATARGSIPSPVAWVSSVLYLAVLCAGVYYHAAGLCGDGLDPGRLGLFVGALAFLLALEWFGRRYDASAARYPALALLALRMIVIEGVAAVDCS